MAILLKIIRKYSNPRYNLLQSMKCSKKIHSNSFLAIKYHSEYQDQYAYSILKIKEFASISAQTPILAEDEFNNLMEEDWSTKRPAALIDVFSKLAVYCSYHNICISNTMFDNFIDKLTDNVEYATDQELVSIFHALNNWPKEKSIKIRNYIEVWVALDDECWKRNKHWSNTERLSFISLFYMLRVVKLSDYCRKCLDKLSDKATQLSPDQLVQTLFYVGVTKRKTFSMPNFEIHVLEIFSSFSVDQLAVMATGFFESKTPIRDLNLVLNIISAITENSKTIHDNSLAALLKLVVYFSKRAPDDRIYKLLDSLQEEVPRLSILCNTCLALLGSEYLHFHEGCLNKIGDNVINHMSETRIKDLERLLLAYGTLNYIPQTKDCFVDEVLSELRKPERTSEIMKFGKSFSRCIANLSLLGIYPVDLINKVLDPEFLTNTYGKNCYDYGKEILILHFTAEIHCADNVVNRLSEKKAKLLAQKYADYMPSEEYKKRYNITESMILDIMRLIKNDRGGSEYVIGDHILPYHRNGDIIMCDDESGAPVKIKDLFSGLHFGLLKRPPEGHIFTVLVTAGRNDFICGTDKPLGPIISKIRDLETLGCNAAVVPLNLYAQLNTIEEKHAFINNIMRNCRKINNK